MKKLSIIAVLTFGMMFTACKKDESVSPFSTDGTVTIEFNTNDYVDILQDDKTIFHKENVSNNNPIDSSIVIKNVADNSRFDIGMFINKRYPATLKIKYNDQVVLDTLIIDTVHSLHSLSVSYFANKELWVTP